MPFTLAHPAAAVPLRGCLGRFGVLSALVIGSMVPDCSHFVPWTIPRSESHSLSGLLWFCLPVGLLAYALFHVVLKGPLLALLPIEILRRLGDHASTFRAMPAVPWGAVVVSLMCGAATHLLWDAFTHDRGAGVVAFPILKSHLFSIGTYHVYTFKILQHASALIGLALLTFWLWRWLAKTPARPASLPVTLSTTQQSMVIITIICCSVGVGLWAGLSGLGATVDTQALAKFIRRTTITALPTAASAVIVYSVAWHWWRLRVENRAPGR